MSRTPNENDTKPELSIVIPIFMCERFIEELVSRLDSIITRMSLTFEIILVNDCSPDDSWNIIETLIKTEKCLRGIHLSKNFGQHYAISAGIDHAKGNWVIVMDGDLQDLPEEIPKLYYQAIKGFDVVLAQRKQRHDSWQKKFLSLVFYKVLSYLTDTKYDGSIANFGIYNRDVIATISNMKEHIRFFPCMIQWAGYSQTAIEIEHAPRRQGKSSYNLRKLCRLALDIILAYSDKPLRLTVKLGLLISLTSFTYVIYTIIQYYKGTITMLGFPTIVASIWLLAGFMIFIQGIMGLYLGKVFECTKNRPIYIISKSLNI